MTPARWMAIAVVGTAMLFAMVGGEYGIWDWWTLRRQERDMIVEVARLKQEVDSLKTLAHQVEIDPKLQERIARESFGMIGRGEYLYVLVPDTLDGN